MRLGLNLPTIYPELSPSDIAAFALDAERRGWHSVWVGEHVVLADSEATEYFPSTAPMPDPLMMLSHLAATTSTIRLGTGICLVAQRDPVYTAKHVATLDWLSGGRVELGVGLGWSPTEYKAVGLAWKDRSTLTTEAVAVMRHLWRDANTETSFAGRVIPASRQFPQPVQEPHPPLWFGGNADSALDRVAELGDGWYGFELAGEELAERLARLDDALAKRGRARSDIQVAILKYGAVTRADAAGLEAGGVDLLVVGLNEPELDGLQAQFRTAAEELQPWAGA